MKPSLFKMEGKPQEDKDPFQGIAQFNTLWENETKEMMDKGYPYQIAYAIVSKKKIQELFEKDIKTSFGG